MMLNQIDITFSYVLGSQKVETIPLSNLAHSEDGYFLHRLFEHDGLIRIYISGISPLSGTNIDIQFVCW